MSMLQQARDTASFMRLILTKQSRRTQMRRLSQQGKAPLMVPFYHRVADTHPNDWTISREKFRQHVEYCRDRFDLVSLSELQQRVATGNSPKPTVTFTFDDGYRENCDFAIPLMLEAKIPCVYFVSVNHIVQQKAFAHDVKAGKPLAVNTESELRDMADHGIEIGLHTSNHVDFSQVHDEATVRHEIIQAKDELEQIVGRPVHHFAFPFGLPMQLTQAAIEAVHAAGLRGFCSAFGAYNLPGRDAFHIRRFHGDADFTRFRNWLSFDPRKVKLEPQIRYFLPPATSHVETTRVIHAELATCS